jgi:penicillin-binding protein 1A
LVLLADACRWYFGLAPGELSWAQESLLAGVVQAPTTYGPLTRLDLAKQRQRDVFNRLVETDVFSRAQADAAYAAPPRPLVPQA